MVNEERILITDFMPELLNQQLPQGALYIVATPIGNRADITCRALHVLATVDVVFCEDTRVTQNLLSFYNLKKSLVRCDQHTQNQASTRMKEYLQQQKRVAFVSDAGTPGMSDPGAALVRAARQMGALVVPIPGVCAATTAFSVSGLYDEQFLFVGFLPTKSGERNKLLQSYKAQNAALIFYEAPHRIVETLTVFKEVFGSERTIVIAKELTKLFEQIYSGTLQEACQWIKEDLARQKGEFVLIVQGNQELTSQYEDKQVLEPLLKVLPVKVAASVAAEITGGKKNHFYDLALDLKQDK